MTTALGLSESATRQVASARQVVSAAGTAPSLLDTQPWRFRLRRDRIEVHAELGRRSIAHDPDDRELRIARGAALLNLQLALHARGVTPVTQMPATVGDRRQHRANQQSELDRQSAVQSTTFGFRGPPAPVVIRHVPGATAVRQRKHLSGREVVAGVGFR